MTTKDLGNFFNSHLVPKKLYSLNSNKNHRICLEQVKNGWDVYFSDKKSKVGISHFNSENDACDFMKNEIKKLMEQLYGITWAAVR